MNVNADFVKSAVSTMDLRPLKLKQLEALQRFVPGKDTFIALPTGYGKSVIFVILILAGMSLNYNHVMHIYIATCIMVDSFFCISRGMFLPGML